MKKKILKIIICLILFIIPVVILTSNRKTTEAQTCSKTVTYYFIKGINMTDQEAGTVTAYDKTNFEPPKEWGDNVTIKDVNVSLNWNSNDTKNYFSNQKTSNCTTGASTAWCDPSDTKCLNSGNGQDYVWQDCGSISVDNGSVSIGGESYDDFASKYFIGANDSGTNVKFEYDNDTNMINAEVDRSWEQTATDSNQEYYDGKWMFQPLKVNVTYGIACEEPKKCQESSGTTINASGCNNYSYSSTYNKKYTTSFVDYEREISNACSDVKISGSGVITFSESGNLSVGIAPKEQYAGGGFAFNLGYSGSASKSFCKEDGVEEEVTCSCSYYKESPEEWGDWLPTNYCLANNITQCKIEDGIKYKRILSPAKCDVETECECTEEEKNKVKSNIESLANEEFGSPTANPSVKSQDSNNEKDLAVDKTAIGTVSAGGGGGSSWVRFTQSHACIELREVVKDGVTYPAYVMYKDTCNVTNSDGYTGEIDGGDKYYIPIKYPDRTAFYVNSNSHGQINVLKGNNWTFDLSCSVDVTQKLYDTPKGYKFIYRPIDMSNPFPKTVNQNREVGFNWVNFMNNETAKTEKLNRADNGLEYYATLDKNSIRNIRKENNSKNYFGLNTINNNGKSSLINNGYLNMVERANDITINNLGECTEDCW